MPKPVTFKTVYTAMKQFKERAAPGGRCDAWTDFARTQPQAARAIAVESAGQFERQQAIHRLLTRGGGWRQHRLRRDNRRMDRSAATKKPRRSNQRGRKAVIWRTNWSYGA
jgi:hypothetical protein